jgi:hypothetical protein
MGPREDQKRKQNHEQQQDQQQQPNPAALLAVRDEVLGNAGRKVEFGCDGAAPALLMTRLIR